MKSKINIVRRDLRALKSTSHAITRLIEAQGIHFVRIKALEALPKSKKTDELISKERELIEALGLAEQIEKSAELEKRYTSALSALDTSDRAMVTDCFIKGEPYYKVAMDYGFSEGGLRKRIDRLVVQIAKSI